MIFSFPMDMHEGVDENKFTWKSISIFSNLFVAAFSSLYSSPYANISSETIIQKRREVSRSPVISRKRLTGGDVCMRSNEKAKNGIALP